MELFLPHPGLWSENFFYKMFLNWSKGLRNNFQNRKGNYQNRKFDNFSHFQASDKKLLWHNISHLFRGFKIHLQNRKWNFPNKPREHKHNKHWLNSPRLVDTLLQDSSVVLHGNNQLWLSYLSKYPTGHAALHKPHQQEEHQSCQEGLTVISHSEGDFFQITRHWRCCCYWWWFLAFTLFRDF